MLSAEIFTQHAKHQKHVKVQQQLYVDSKGNG